MIEKGLFITELEFYEELSKNQGKKVHRQNLAARHAGRIQMIDLIKGKVCSLEAYKQAIEAYKQAIKLKPDDAGAYYGLGAAYLFIGDKESAPEEYKILKILDPESANKLFNLIHK